MTRTELEDRLVSICDNNPITANGFHWKHQFQNGRLWFAMADNKWDFGGFAVTLMGIGPNQEVDEERCSLILCGFGAYFTKLRMDWDETEHEVSPKKLKSLNSFITNACCSMMYMVQNIEELITQEYEIDNCIPRCRQNSNAR